MKASTFIVLLVPIAAALIIINCIAWTLARLKYSGLPVRMGIGWPWPYYTYEVNRVGPSEWSTGTFLLDVAVAVGILAASAGLIALYMRWRRPRAWE